MVRCSMKERTILAIEGMMIALEKGVRALGLNALQNPLEVKQLDEAREEFTDAMANEEITS